MERPPHRQFQTADHGHLLKMDGVGRRTKTDRPADGRRRTVQLTDGIRRRTIKISKCGQRTKVRTWGPASNVPRRCKIFRPEMSSPCPIYLVSEVFVRGRWDKSLLVLWRPDVVSLTMYLVNYEIIFVILILNFNFQIVSHFNLINESLIMTRNVISFRSDKISNFLLKSSG